MQELHLPDQQMMLELQKIVRDYKAGKLGGSIASTPTDIRQYVPPPLYVHNDAAEEIPAWACMQITGTEEIGGQNYLVADKPADNDGSAGWFLFNGPAAIEDGGNGIAQPYAIVRAFKNAGTVTAGQYWQPVANQWYIEQDDAGVFPAAGEDDIGTDVLRVFASAWSPGITDLRLSGANLQYFLGGTWTTWHTGTSCP